MDDFLVEMIEELSPLVEKGEVVQGLSQIPEECQVEPGLTGGLLHLWDHLFQVLDALDLLLMDLK